MDGDCVGRGEEQEARAGVEDDGGTFLDRGGLALMLDGFQRDFPESAVVPQDGNVVDVSSVCRCVGSSKVDDSIILPVPSTG